MKVIISAGGTGGHFFPAIAIAEELKKRIIGCEVLFIGTGRELESKMLKERGFNFMAIHSSGIKKKISLNTFKAIFELFRGFTESIKIMRKIKPNIVVGMGSYVCVPVILASSCLNVPTLIHEQNLLPGRANRLLGYIVDKIAISFEDSTKYFPKGKVVLTGNPIRENIITKNRNEAIKDLGFDSSKRTILVFGGSQGAHSVNYCFLEVLKYINSYKEKIQIIWATGEKDYQEISNLAKNCPIKTLISPFFVNMAEVYAIVDLAICRSGATTIAELTTKGIPAIFIPYPYATNNHQELNADFVSSHSGGITLLEKNLNGKVLADAIIDIIDNTEKLKNMSEAMKKIAKPEAAKAVVDLITKTYG